MGILVKDKGSSSGDGKNAVTLTGKGHRDLDEVDTHFLWVKSKAEY